jgi:putative hydrolase of the HAD superfamily
VVKEKNKATYLQLAEERGFDPDKTWMIGNSPRSDMNPALEAGLRAVFVPHARTWSLEKEEIRDPFGRLIVVERFTQLAELFG